MSVQKTCMECGASFEVSDYQSKIGKGKYCSDDCKRKEGGRRSTTHFPKGKNNPRFTHGKRASGMEDYDQRKVHKILQNAVHSGAITPLPCEKCGATHDLHGHHDDYTKPLDVRWFCRSCHTLYHISPW